MFAGYLAAIYAVLAKTFDLWQAQPIPASLLLLALAALGLVFAVADLRGRELYHAATEAAACLEKGRPPTLYQALNEPPAQPDKGSYGPHTRALFWVYRGGAVLFALGALGLLAYAIRC